jgi:putative transposase
MTSSLTLFNRSYRLGFLGVFRTPSIGFISLKEEWSNHCLEKDREELLASYDFPAYYWPHIRTTNPIESIFSTIKLRAKKSRGCVNRTTIMTMICKFGLSAENCWRKIRRFRRLADVINGTKLIGGIDGETIERKRNLS